MPFVSTAARMTLGLSPFENALIQPGVFRSPLSISRAQAAGVQSSALAADDVALQFFDADTPRFSGSARRLLVEGSRSNLIEGMAAPVTQNVTVTAAAHTLSFWGTGSIVLSGAASGTLNGTGANNRVTLTFTPTAGTLTLTISGAVTRAQLGLGGFASSYIQSPSGAATRGADLVTASLASLGVPATGGCTVLWSGVVPNLNPAAPMQIWQVDDGGNTNRMFLRVAQNTNQLNFFVFGATQSALGNFTAGAPFKAGASYDPATGRMGASLNGAPVVATTGGTLAGATTFRVGHQPSGAADAFMETGYLRVLPPVSDADLQALTLAMP